MSAHSSVSISLSPFTEFTIICLPFSCRTIAPAACSRSRVVGVGHPAKVTDVMMASSSKCVFWAMRLSCSQSLV